MTFSLMLVLSLWAHADNLTDAQIKASSSTLTCADATCLPSAGLLAIVKPDQSLEACTGSLVQDDLVMTNSHCIPQDLKFDGASCAGRIWMHFAPTDGRADYEERLECAQVVTLSPLEKGQMRPDVAFLRMRSKSHRPVLRVRRAGLIDQALYHLWKVDSDFGDNGITGRLSRLDCRAIHGTDVTGSTNPLYPLIVLSDCQVVPGYSGSAVLDDQDQIRAVVQGYLPIGNARKVAADKGMDLVDGGLAPINLATNLACRDLPFAAEAPPAEACEVTRQEEAEEKTFPADPDLAKVQVAFMDKLAANPDWSRVKWSMDVRKETRTDSWGGQHQLRVLRGLADCRTQDMQGSFAAPDFLLLYGLDRYLRPGFRIVSDSLGKAPSVDPASLPLCASP